MTTRAETIANHLRQIRMLPASDVRCLHLAFLECLGGAECASPAPAAEGPWVVRLPLAEAERAEKEGPLRTSYPHGAVVAPQPDDADHSAAPWGYANTDSPDVWHHEPDDADDPSVVPAEVHERGWQWRPVGDDGAFAPPFGTIRKCLGCGALVAGGTTRCVRCVEAMPAMESANDLTATLRREECERKAARQAVPAGWVVRAKHPEHGIAYAVTERGSTASADHGIPPYVFATRIAAQAIADSSGWHHKWTRTVLPVDAAGNVIEAADDSVPWQDVAAAEAQEVNRLNAELAAVKAERDTARAERDTSLAECERKAARQAKPAGWVVRLSNGQLRWLWMRTVASGAEYEPYATREDAQRIADTTGDEAVPVDAAGNVIEGGVAWEASRSYEEAERLRAELATWKRTAEQRMERIRSVKAERDDRSARCDAAETDVARLTKERDAARAERDTAKAERDKLTTDEADLRYALRQIAGLVGGAVGLGASTEMHCAVVDEVRAVVGQRGKVPDVVQLASRANIADDRLAVHDERLDNVHARLAALEHRAPVVRDHSEVIAQCEEALRRCSLRGKDDALLAALAALRGAP